MQDQNGISTEPDWLKRWALYSPQKIALHDISSQKKLSYQQLYQASCLLAHKLQEDFAVNPGDRIAVLSKNSWEYILLFFASQRVGAILVPINFRLTHREIEHILADSAPRLFIYQTAFEESAGELHRDAYAYSWKYDGPESLKEFADQAILHSSSQHLDFSSFDENNPCMILYTSGTTGTPKGALITYKMIFWNSINTGLRLNLTQNDIHISFLPLFHTGGWNVLLTPFFHRGATTLLMEKFDADQVLKICDQESVTLLFAVPTMMDMMAQSPKFSKTSLSSVRYAIVGGEPMPLKLIHTWQNKGVPIRQGYGLTEFGPNVFSLNEEDSLRKIGSIGFPNFYVQVKVVDLDGQPVKSGDVGELLLKGPTCTPGYWQNESATTEAIIDGWFRTGDLVRQDTEGFFYVVGRKKDMYISGGENVYPAEVERVLQSHPHILEAAVIGIPDDKWGEVGKAFIVASSGQKLSSEEIMRFCLRQLAKFKVPKSFEFLEELPKGDSGKVLKRVLSQKYQ